MAVEMHRMHLAIAVVDVHHRHVTVAYHIHRHIRREVAVDRPPHTWQSLDEAGSATDPVLEPAGGLRRVEAEWRWRTVAQQIQLFGRLWRHRRSGAWWSDDNCGRLGRLNSRCSAVAGYVGFEIGS